MSELSAMVEALRSRGSSDEHVGEATRIRLRRSLETRARARVRAVRALVIAGIVLGATGAWALSTGRAGALWSRIASGDEIEAVEPAHPISMRLDEPVRPKGPPQLAVPDVRWPDAPAKAPEAPPPRPQSQPPPPPPAPPRPRVRPAAPVAKAEAIDPLYRAAHELHFRGGDHAATLAAWDAYLAAEPGGRFVVEARYNRAIVLVRLARYDDARVALEPFAHGEVVPAGYRQREARALLERIGKLERPITKPVNE